MSPLLDYSTQERHRATRVNPTKGYKDDKEVGASLLQGKAKAAGPVQPGKENTNMESC